MANDATDIPVQVQTLDADTGAVVHEGMTMAKMLPAPEGTCAECAVKHEPHEPHDATSLFYQYRVYGKTGRWPNWKDAMAHCSDETRVAVTAVLVGLGVNVEAGQVRPDGEA